MHALMRQAQQSRCIARAEFQIPLGQRCHGLAGRSGRPPALFVGFSAGLTIARDGATSRGGHSHAVDDPVRIDGRVEQRQRLDNASPRLVNRPSLRMAASHRWHMRHPPAVAITVVDHRHTPHPSLPRQRAPKQGSKSRSIRRNRPGPMSSPACTGTVVTHVPHWTRTCDPRCRTAAQPSAPRPRSNRLAVTGHSLRWRTHFCLVL